MSEHPIKLKFNAVVTDIRPGDAAEGVSGSWKNSSSTPRLCPNTYSARVSRANKSTIPPQACARRVRTWFPISFLPSHNAIPLRRNERAVLAFILANPGSMLLRRVISNIQPHNTVSPTATEMILAVVVNEFNMNRILLFGWDFILHTLPYRGYYSLEMWRNLLPLRLHT